MKKVKIKINKTCLSLNTLMEKFNTYQLPKFSNQIKYQSNGFNILIEKSNPKSINK